MITHGDITMETLTDPCPDASYLDQEGCEERLQELHDGRFGFIGIRASCTLQIGVGQPGHTILHCFKSPGLWNIESDSSSEHLRQIFEDQKSILLAMLDAIGCHSNGQAEQAS